MLRTRYTIPPSGARATAGWNRLETYGQAAALEAFRPEGTLDFTKHGLVGSSTYHDAWLAQAGLGAKVAVDHDRHLWLGALTRHARQLGVAPHSWSTIAGSATFVFGH